MRTTRESLRTKRAGRIEPSVAIAGATLEASGI